MNGFDRIGVDAGSLAGDPEAWRSLLILVAVGVTAMLVGAVIGRRIGLVPVTAGSLETLAVGLALGLVLAAMTYGVIRSGGRTTYLPAVVLLGIAIAVGRGAVRRPIPSGGLRAGAALLAFAVGWAFLYGVTISPSERAGAQPVEFMDEAFYGVLGAVLRDTGVESVYLAAGLGELAGQPTQTWYHWGEGWLAALVLETGQVGPMAARHLVVLPLIAASTVGVIAAVAGSLVDAARRRQAIVLGAIGMAALAPVPLLLDWHFDWWARALGFSMTTYGLAYAVVALGIHALIRGVPREAGARPAVWGALVATLVASHIALAGLAAVAATVAAIVHWSRAGRPSVWQRRHEAVPVAFAGTAVIATIGWGWLTGHGLANDGLVAGVAPFDDAWRRAIGLSVIGAAALIVGVALAISRIGRHEALGSLAIGSVIAFIAGAVFWGYRLPDFNAFHVYFGALAVLVTPIAVLGLVVAAMDARSDGRPRLALTLTLLLLLQSAIGIGASIQRLYEFGPGHYADIPTDMLDAVRDLPAEARLAYACEPFEEVAAWDARLISITAHTGRPLVPMCFQADTFRHQLGKASDTTIENPFFRNAPQRSLYPTALAAPGDEQTRSFMERYGIDYIWIDPDHPDLLVSEADLVHQVDGFAIYQLP